MIGPLLGRRMRDHSTLLRGAGLTALFLMLAPLPGHAVDPGSDPWAPDTPFADIRVMIEQQQFARAETELRTLLPTHQDNADIANMLGFVLRKQGEFTEARVHYDRALALEPAHLGALEYKGELELQTGDPEAARVLYRRLAAACPEDCHELEDLREAFEAAGEALPSGKD